MTDTQTDSPTPDPQVPARISRVQIVETEPQPAALAPVPPGSPYQMRRDALPEHVRQAVLQQVADVASGDIHSLLQRFLARRKETTLETYRSALDRFAEFFAGDLTHPLTVSESLMGLFALQVHEAHGVVGRWVDEMKAAQVPTNTIAVRIHALRSLCNLARQLGYVEWQLEVPVPRPEVLRDVRGPEDIVMEHFWQEVRDQKKERVRARDTCLFTLLYAQALRRGEVASLRVEDIDFENQLAMALRKGRHERREVQLFSGTLQALRVWLGFRGEEPGPLLLNFSPRLSKQPIASRGLTGNGIWRVLRGYAKKVAKKLERDAEALRLRPHALRHGGITSFVGRVDGDVTQAQKFSGHASVQMVLRYVDHVERIPDAVGNLMDKFMAEEQEDEA